MQMRYEPISLTEVKKLFDQPISPSIHPLHLDGLEVILNMRAGDFNGKNIFKIELAPHKTFRLHCHQNPAALGVVMERLNPTFTVGKTHQGFFIDLAQSFVLRVKFKLCEINLDQIPDPVLCKLPEDLEKEHLIAINYVFAKNPLFILEFRKEFFNRETKESSGAVKSIMFKFPAQTTLAAFKALTDNIRKDLGDSAFKYAGLAREQNTYCFELEPSLLKNFYHKMISAPFAKSAVELSQSQLLSTNGLFNSKIAEAPASVVLAPVEIPNQFLCSISLELMVEPVILEDGYTYEKSVIEQVLKTNPKSPITRAPVNPNILIPNRAVKDLIEQFVKDHPEVAQEHMAVPVAPK